MVAPITIYFEGSSDLREGFSAFFSGIPGGRPKLVAGKSFANTIRAFVIAVEHSSSINFLLVDADGPNDGKLLQKVRGNPEWNSTLAVCDEQVHFMVQVMESWLLADKSTLESYYGRDFRATRLPPNPKVEQVSKDDVLRGLHDATRGTGKGPYHKTRHAPALLALIDTAKVRSAAPSCARLFHAIEVQTAKPRSTHGS